MKRSEAVFFFLIFCYLLAGWTGFWAIHTNGSADVTTSVHFEPGFFETLRLESSFLDRLQDPLLEGDSRPDRLFEAVHRDLTRNLVMAAAFGFLLLFIPLAALAGVQGRWFYTFMKRMVFLPVSAFLLVSLLFPARGLTASSGQNMLLLIPIAWKSLLLFISTACWMQSGPTESQGDFLTHLKGERLDLRHQLTERLRPMGTDLATVMLVGAAITNIILLPFFQLQLLFAQYFAALLIPGLLLLAAYYVYSYRHVAQLRGESTSWSVAISFLAFRIMRNMLFLAGVVTILIVALAIIFAIIYGNLGLLQGTGIIRQTKGL